MFQNHFSTKHKTEDDVHVKPQHRVGSGPLQVAIVQEQVSFGDQDPPEIDDDPGEEEFGAEEEEEEHFAQESYKALK